MISRTSLILLFLATLLGFWIWHWNLGHADACSAYLGGDKMAPATMYVQTGTRSIVVPCDQWLMRMPGKVQLLCLVEFGLVLIFVVNALGDVRDGFEARRRMRGLG
jgi:hypothetical protein